MSPTPPIAAIHPHAVSSPHGTRQDPYYWLRDDTRQSPEVLAYLEAENAYTAAVFAPWASLEAELFSELRSRVQEEDASVPVFDRGYWYYVRYETGKQYPIYARKPGSLEAAEQIVLDGNALAAGHAFYKIGYYAVSPDGQRVAWAEDTVGRNQFVLRIKYIDSGAYLPDTATNIANAIVWAADGETLFYTGKDEVTLRADRVYRKQLGDPEAVLVHLEADASFYVRVGETKSRRYITIDMRSTTCSEHLIIPANAPQTPPRALIAREPEHIYGLEHLDHCGDRFIVRTNDHAKNFRLVEVPSIGAAERSQWRELVPHRDDTLLEAVAVFERVTALSVRSGGLRKVQVLPALPVDERAFYIDAQDPCYVMSVVDLPDPASTRVRYTYESLTQPASVFELDLTNGARSQLKQQPVPTYDGALYTSAYLHARAADGTLIPISLVHRKTTPLDGSAPLLVYGYGSYGHSTEPSFSAHRVSLLDRGFVYAIAHVRGGQEMGRAWYEAGKLQAKQNTFTDFIAVTEHLIATSYAARDRVFAMGGSAGGLLVGAVANLRPDLYRGIVAFVPFVDVVTTMLDESIPLTTNEYDEWGNPRADRAAYDYMLSYSPYDNMVPQPYPAIYVHTGLWDSQVQYWEPAKWTAKLRAQKLGDALLLLDTNMTAGHGGASGRFDALKELARAYTFVLSV